MIKPIRITLVHFGFVLFFSVPMFLFAGETRDAEYSSSSLGSRHQKVGTISLVYNHLSDFHLGSVEWGRSNKA